MNVEMNAIAGDGIKGANGDPGLDIDCAKQCPFSYPISQYETCNRPYPLLNFQGQQTDEKGRNIRCAANYNPQTKDGQGLGHPGKLVNSTSYAIFLEEGCVNVASIPVENQIPIAKSVQGGLPGRAGNSTYSGSGGSIILTENDSIFRDFLTNSSFGTPLFVLAKYGKPGPGGRGGPGDVQNLARGFLFSYSV